MHVLLGVDKSHVPLVRSAESLEKQRRASSVLSGESWYRLATETHQMRSASCAKGILNTARIKAEKFKRSCWLLEPGWAFYDAMPKQHVLAQVESHPRLYRTSIHFVCLEIVPIDLAGCVEFARKT